MTLKKKLLLSNILMVVLPIALILLLWTGYIHLNSGTYLKTISRSSQSSDRLADAMKILYTYEAELSGMNWDVVLFQDDTSMNTVVSPDKERIEELQNLGYHIRLGSENGINFSNMDDNDQSILEEISTETDGAIYWSGNSLVIQDSFQVMGITYYLTAIYDESRVDQGVQDSLIPMYMVSPSLIVLFLLVAIGSIALTSVLVSRWLSQSILHPLQELEKATDRIANDELDYPLIYNRKDEFGDVCKAFDHMRLQLKEARKQKSEYEEERREMLRGISHDLRSPLTSIKGYTMGLRDGIADTPEKQKRYYEAILTRADDMERLTESLSLFVRMENDKSLLQPVKVCLDEYLLQLIDEKGAWLAEKQIRIDYRNLAKDAEVYLDIREMQRVFMNLFENTLRYREKEYSEAKILVSQKEQDIEISYTDDGPGVALRHLPHIFECFYRADESRTSPGQGSGIGLAVVKKIVEGQGGQVCASSEKGLCITITLPAAKEVLADEENIDRGR